ncbi:patatin-like protein [Ramlibacter sp. 2FC]|uniref:patatin-like protein n=1 Tax=Ramlibacter sp. 2FC TaxID=2502188 RepID=UPI0010F51206|nr:patatin-like protein [Ramlibacter sp. 2FC]
MKEKELRLAVVFFGGVSLAIYQHGINREILNLVRASKISHRDKSLEGEVRSSRFHDHYPDEPERSTGEVYLEFLETLGRDIDLRVIVDVIAGASAGGINGVALATALAHDLSLMPITDMWLQEADMLNLLAPEARARLWSKWYFWPLVQPLLKRLDREGLLPGPADAEMKERVSVFLRSRWFKPPLDGRRLTALMLDGLAAMGKSGAASESLLPTGTRLDLLITVTDFRGLDRPIFIHDPPVAHEREHRHILHFGLDHLRTGHLKSDFDVDNLPSLAFACRATASYPGAFPPAQVREIDDILAERHRPWPARTYFLERNFKRYHELGENPEEAVLVDGSVLDNKPITACVEAIRTHGAYREVDRRLVFVDPRPRRDSATAGRGVPGFFATLRGALSDLPRQEPVYNELAVISHYNRQARRLKATILHARPHVERMVEQLTEGRLRGSFTADDLRHWRLEATKVMSGTPIVFDAWQRSLVLEGLDFIVQLVAGACRYAADSREARQVQEIIEAWAVHEGILASSYVIPAGLYEYADRPIFTKIVGNFGVIYKKRRLHFVLHEINDLYQNLAQDGGVPDPQALDLLKIKVQKCIDDLSVYDDIGCLSRQAQAACRRLFVGRLLPGPPQAGEDQGLGPQDIADLSKLVERLGQECDMERMMDNADAVIASPLLMNLGERCRVAVLTGYLGYFYWDIILRPTASALSLDAGPIEEILIDRISPEDAATLRFEDSRDVLIGGTFAGFGGFLSRAIRENDYLWGRLHAVDRLFDILASTVPANRRGEFDLRALKKRAFECVLEEEGARLSLVPQLLARLREAVARL